ncbi:MAG TPA: hemolysin family protein [Actinocrinis sp.]
MSAAASWPLLGAAASVAVAGLAACVESALGRISGVRAEELLAQGVRGAARIVRLTADPARYVNLLLLIRVSGEMAAAVLVAMVCVSAWRLTWGAGLLAAGSMIVVSYIAVGVMPRTLGRRHAEAIAATGGAVLLPLSTVLGPLARGLILVGNALTPGRGFREGPFATEAELRALIDIAEQNSEIEAAERRMVHSVFELGDTLVREVMVPRTEMVSIERAKTLRQALSLALRSGFSRIPVTGQDEDDVVGIVYLKDLASRLHEDFAADGAGAGVGTSTATGTGGSRDALGDLVGTVMRQATFVPDSKHADDLLRDMQAQRIHLAIVIDEYGGTAGLVTIEDILEEIVGEITDEYDTGRPEVEWLGRPGDAAEGARVSARFGLDQLGELFGRDLEDEDVDTVGGLLAKQLGKVPIPGARADVAGLRLIAESPEGRRRRIGTIVVQLAKTADGGAGGFGRGRDGAGVRDIVNGTDEAARDRDRDWDRDRERDTAKADDEARGED